MSNQPRNADAWQSVLQLADDGHLCLTAPVLNLMMEIDQADVLNFLVARDTTKKASIVLFRNTTNANSTAFFAFLAGAMGVLQGLQEVKIVGEAYSAIACMLKYLPTRLLPVTSLCLWAGDDYGLNLTAFNALGKIICCGRSKKLDKIAVRFYGSFGPARNRVLAEAIAYNQIHTESLVLCYKDGLPLPSPSTCLLFRSLGYNTTLSSMTLEVAPIPETCRALKRGLGRNFTLRKLKIKFEGASISTRVETGQRGMAEVLEGLQANRSLEDLEWGFAGYSFDHALWCTFSAYISGTTVLQSVGMVEYTCFGFIEDPAWQTLTYGLSENKSIRSFQLEGFRISVSNDAFASSMSDLRVHPSLEVLALSKVEKSVDCHPTQYLLKGVPQLTGGHLKTLRILPEPGLVDGQCDAFFDALWHNQSLRECPFWTAKCYQDIVTISRREEVVVADLGYAHWLDPPIGLQMRGEPSFLRIQMRERFLRMHNEMSGRYREINEQPWFLRMHNEMNDRYREINERAEAEINMILHMNGQPGARGCLLHHNAPRGQVVELLIAASSNPGCCFKIFQMVPMIFANLKQ